MNVLFISGYSGWGKNFLKVADKLSQENTITGYKIITQGVDSYEDFTSYDNEGGHIVFEHLYKQFLLSPNQTNLDDLEKIYGSLYKIAATDRTLIQHTHPLNYGYQHNYEFVTNYVAYWLNFFEDYFKNNKTDVLVTSVIASVMPLAAALVSRKNNIKLLNLGVTRYPDRVTFYEDIKMTQRVLLSSPTPSDFELAEKLIDKKNRNLVNPSWSDWNVKVNNPFNLRHYFNSMQINKLYKKYNLYFDLSDFRDPILFLPTIPLRVKKYLNKIFRSYYYRNLKKLSKLPQTKFYIYALHVDPEMATTVLAPNWVDQLDLIKRIRVNMPHDKKLLVKEHPTMIGVRDINFYKQLLSIPGIIICSDNIPTEELIKHSSLCISITGTVAFEAALYNKPSFLFAETDFSFLSSIGVFNGCLDNLDYQLIQSEKNVQCKDELKEFLANNYANSVKIKGIDVWNAEQKDNTEFLNEIRDLLEICLHQIEQNKTK